ncbi:MAG: hypothetical protein ACOC1F_00990 [Myxococcota bacterium]
MRKAFGLLTDPACTTPYPQDYPQDYEVGLTIALRLANAACDRVALRANNGGVCMGPAAQQLWDWIQTELIGDETRAKWTNTVSYGVTVDEDHLNEMVIAVFGGFNRIRGFTNKSDRFKMKALPLQNKHSRTRKAYQNYHGGENMVNIVAFPVGGKNVFNLHVQVRKQAYAEAARKKAQQKAAFEAGGWSTA